jgi:hypothetical protein
LLAFVAIATKRIKTVSTPPKPTTQKGDDGQPGGAALHQAPVPLAFVGRPYHELVTALLLCDGTGGTGTGGVAPWAREVPLGLLRRKSENRAWR